MQHSQSPFSPPSSVNSLHAPSPSPLPSPLTPQSPASQTGSNYSRKPPKKVYLNCYTEGSRRDEDQSSTSSSTITEDKESQTIWSIPLNYSLPLDIGSPLTSGTGTDGHGYDVNHISHKKFRHRRNGRDRSRDSSDTQDECESLGSRSSRHKSRIGNSTYVRQKSAPTHSSQMDCDGLISNAYKELRSPLSVEPRTPGDPRTSLDTDPWTPISEPKTPMSVGPRTPGSCLSEPRTPMSFEPRTPHSVEPKTPQSHSSYEPRTPSSVDLRSPQSHCSSDPRTPQSHSSSDPSTPQSHSSYDPRTPLSVELKSPQSHSSYDPRTPLSAEPRTPQSHKSHESRMPASVEPRTPQSQSCSTKPWTPQSVEPEAPQSHCTCERRTPQGSDAEGSYNDCAEGASKASCRVHPGVNHAKWGKAYRKKSADEVSKDLTKSPRNADLHSDSEPCIDLSMPKSVDNNEPRTPLSEPRTPYIEPHTPYTVEPGSQVIQCDEGDFDSGYSSKTDSSEDQIPKGNVGWVPREEFLAKARSTERDLSCDKKSKTDLIDLSVKSKLPSQPIGTHKHKTECSSVNPAMDRTVHRQTSEKSERVEHIGNNAGLSRVPSNHDMECEVTDDVVLARSSNNKEQSRSRPPSPLGHRQVMGKSNCDKHWRSDWLYSANQNGNPCPPPASCDNRGHNDNPLTNSHEQRIRNTQRHSMCSEDSDMHHGHRVEKKKIHRNVADSSQCRSESSQNSEVQKMKEIHPSLHVGRSARLGFGSALTVERADSSSMSALSDSTSKHSSFEGHPNSHPLNTFFARELEPWGYDPSRGSGLLHSFSAHAPKYTNSLSYPPNPAIPRFIHPALPAVAFHASNGIPESCRPTLNKPFQQMDISHPDTPSDQFHFDDEVIRNIKKEIPDNHMFCPPHCQISGFNPDSADNDLDSNDAFSECGRRPSFSQGRKRPTTDLSADSTESVKTKRTIYQKEIEKVACQVCGDIASGFHCGAYVCEACKKFFIRSSKNGSVKYMCSKSQTCVITKESRTQCQHCRYQKCLDIGMLKPGSDPMSAMDADISHIPCKVCGAPSSGFHFGAITCEGCKGFFRRTIKERDSYRYSCSKGGNCSITMATRNACKYCRFRKCLEAGMTPEGSRIGRQPNSVKHATMLELKQIHSTMKTTNTNQIADLSSCQQTTIPQFPIPAKIQLKKELNILTESDFNYYERSILLAMKDLIGIRKRPDGMPRISNFAPHAMWQILMSQFSHDAHCALKFAKKIPGFRKLPISDQITLVQTSLYQMCLFMHIDLFDPETKKINYFNFNEEEQAAIMSTFPNFTVFADHFVYFGQTLQALNMDEMEYGFLAALQLMSSDDGELKSSDRIDEIQECISQSLQNYIERKEGPDTNRFGFLLLRLPELRLASINHQHVILNLKKQMPDLPFPQLFTEMFLNDAEEEENADIL